MRTRQQGFIGVLIVGLTVGWAGHEAEAKPSKALVCEAAKLTAAGSKAQCVASAEAKGIFGGTPNPAACSTEFTTAFAKAEAKAGPGACPTEGDAAVIGG